MVILTYWEASGEVSELRYIRVFFISVPNDHTVTIILATKLIKSDHSKDTPLIYNNPTSHTSECIYRGQGGKFITSDHVQGFLVKPQQKFFQHQH